MRTFMSLIILFAAISATMSQAAVVCRNGYADTYAKNECAQAAYAVGDIKRISEAYGAIGFNQISKFCFQMTDGRVCDCYYNSAPFRSAERNRRDKSANAPIFHCSQSQIYNESFQDCTGRLRRECRGE